MSPTIRAALDEVDRWSPDNADLEPLRQQVRGFLNAAFSVPGSATPSLALDDEETPILLDRIREGWREGVPAARVVKPVVEPGAVLARARGLDACAAHDFLPAVRFRVVLRNDPQVVLGWVDTRLTEGEEGLAAALGTAGIEPDYASAILRLALLGELGEWSARVTSKLDGALWPRGDCPVCGALPALAENRGLEQRRFLRCACCGAGWPGNRLQCAFCGTADHHSLMSRFAAEDQGRCRLVACESCGGRLKVVATLAPLTAPGLLVAEMTTLHLDFIVLPGESDRPPERMAARTGEPG